MTEGRIAGHPVQLRELGQGPRKVLALHCSLAHGGAWSALAAALGPDVTLVAPDLPGHGASADVPDGGDLHALSTAIAAELAARIGGGGPVDVFGHSFGGTVALRLALEQPGLVRSLALFEPVLFCAARLGAPEVHAQWMRDQAPFAAMMDAGDLYGAAEWFNTLWGQDRRLADLPPPQRDYIVARMPLITATNAVLFDDSAGMLAPGRPEALSVPILLVEGAASPPVVRAIGDGLAARIPGLSRLVVPEAGHMVPLTHAPSLAAPLRRHLGLALANGGDRQ